MQHWLAKDRISNELLTFCIKIQLFHITVQFKYYTMHLCVSCCRNPPKKGAFKKVITILPTVVTLVVWNLRLLPLMLKSDVELPELLIEWELQEMRSVEWFRRWIAPEGDWERPGSEGVREWQGVAGLLLFWVGGGGAARFFILPWELKPGTGINQNC